MHLPNRRSIRLKGYDYRDGGMYFVTICTRNMECVFGDIRNGIMGLNDIGCVVADCWQQIPTHFPSIELDSWIIMPNHIHGLIYIEDHFIRTNDACTGDACVAPTLGTIIGSFKSAASKRIHHINPDFAWLRNYYEHISRSPDETARIRRYILNNPARWHSRFNE